MGLRADELTTRAATAGAFVRSGSGQVMLGAVLAAAVGRALVGSWGWFDLVVVVMTIVLTGPVEWLLHRNVLHAGPGRTHGSREPDGTRRSWPARLGLGEGHRRHHLDPGDLQYLMLAGPEAAGFLVLLTLFSVTWVGLSGVLLGFETLAGPVVTAVGAAWVAATHYEWTHLLVHTRYRPRSRYYARLARNHRLHHYRNEDYWLGVTSNVGDRLLGTLPSSKSAVAVSATARTLIDR